MGLQISQVCTGTLFLARDILPVTGVYLTGTSVPESVDGEPFFSMVVSIGTAADVGAVCLLVGISIVVSTLVRIWNVARVGLKRHKQSLFDDK